MGGTDYSFSSRSMRTQSFVAKNADGSFKVDRNKIFEQNLKRETHESMLPSGDKGNIREARDSEVHPYTTPVIIALDITGSMGDIPEHLVREGLPKIVSLLMKKGIAHPAIMIMAVGDSRCDKGGTFQIGQFESGDKEMDLWLERMWIRAGGGGNYGESYGWPYYYAKNHVVTDAWEKRKDKGFIFTIGDDHCHPSITDSELGEVMGKNRKGETCHIKDLVKELKDRWHIYHIDLDTRNNNQEDSQSQTTIESWKALLGEENAVRMERNDYVGIGEKITDIIASMVTTKDFSRADKEEKETAESTTDTKPTIML